MSFFDFKTKTERLNETRKELFTELFQATIRYIEKNYKDCELSIPETNKLTIEKNNLSYGSKNLRFKITLDNTITNPTFDAKIVLDEDIYNYQVSGLNYTSFKIFLITDVYDYMKEKSKKEKEENYYSDNDDYYDKYYHKSRSRYYDDKSNSFNFDFGDIDDDIFKEFFKKMNDKKQNESHSYQRTYEQRTTYTSGSSLDNAFKLMKLEYIDSEIVIKKRYRELSMKWHPDRWYCDNVENQAIANRNFVKLNNAYELIKKFKNIK